MRVDLPMDVIEHILSYGDPEVTMKYKAVINQINYYNKEYEYLRHQAFNFYYNWRKEDVIYFMFNRSYFKVQARGVYCNCQGCINARLKDKKIKEDKINKWKKNKKREERRIRAYNERHRCLDPENLPAAPLPRNKYIFAALALIQ